MQFVFHKINPVLLGKTDQEKEKMVLNTTPLQQ